MKQRTTFTLIASLALASGFLFTGCPKDVSAEKAGEKIDETLEKAGDKIEEGAENVKDAAKEAADNVQDAVDTN